MILTNNQYQQQKTMLKSMIFLSKSSKRKKEKEATSIIPKTKKENNFQMTKLIVKKGQNQNPKNSKKTQKALVLLEKIRKPCKWLLKQSHISNNLYCFYKNKRKSF